MQLRDTCFAYVFFGKCSIVGVSLTRCRARCASMSSLAYLKARFRRCTHVQAPTPPISSVFGIAYITMHILCRLLKIEENHEEDVFPCQEVELWSIRVLLIAYSGTHALRMRSGPCMACDRQHTPLTPAIRSSKTLPIDSRAKHTRWDGKERSKEQTASPPSILRWLLSSLHRYPSRHRRVRLLTHKDAL